MSISNNQIFAKKLAKKGDRMRVLFDSLVVQEGFNRREHDEDFEQSIQALADHIAAGGYIPPLVVRFGDGESPIIIDGHRRHAALSILGGGAFGDGYVDIERIECDNAQAKAIMVTSADGRPLKPLELGAAVLDLQAEGLKNADIARLINMTSARVDQLAIIGHAPEEIKQMIRDGSVSAALATETIRKHGPREALERLQKELDKAKEQGKKKVKPGSLKVTSDGEPVDFEPDVPSKNGDIREMRKTKAEHVVTVLGRNLYEKMDHQEVEQLRLSIDGKNAEQQVLVDIDLLAQLFNELGVDFMTAQVFGPAGTQEPDEGDNEQDEE